MLSTLVLTSWLSWAPGVAYAAPAAQPVPAGYLKTAQRWLTFADHTPDATQRQGRLRALQEQLNRWLQDYPADPQLLHLLAQARQAQAIRTKELQTNELQIEP